MPKCLYAVISFILFLIPVVPLIAGAAARWQLTHKQMLQIDCLSKSYGHTRVLNCLTLEALPGQVTAVVGPNGAGKTTLFSILAGVIAPDSGQCWLNDVPYENWQPSAVGYLAAEPFYYGRLTGRQFLSFERSMRQIDLPNARLEPVLEEWNAQAFADQPLRKLSQGMRKRILMACAFLGDPDLVILDEPLNGLDAQGVILLKDQISQARSTGCHILMCSHLLDFAQANSDQVMLLRDGTVRTFDPTEGTLEEVYQRSFLS